MMYVDRAVVDEDPSTEKFIPTGTYVLAHMNYSCGMMFWITPSDCSTSSFCKARRFYTKENALKDKKRLDELIKRVGKLHKIEHHPLEGRLFVQEVFLRKVDEAKGSCA